MIEVREFVSLIQHTMIVFSLSSLICPDAVFITTASGTLVATTPILCPSVSYVFLDTLRAFVARIVFLILPQVFYHVIYISVTLWSIHEAKDHR